LDRITGFATTGRSQSFGYDATGNLLTQIGADWCHSDQLHLHHCAHQRQLHRKRKLECSG
jgi:hypothetical protein